MYLLKEIDLRHPLTFIRESRRGEERRRKEGFEPTTFSLASLLHLLLNELCACSNSTLICKTQNKLSCNLVVQMFKDCLSSNFVTVYETARPSSRHDRSILSRQLEVNSRDKIEMDYGLKWIMRFFVAIDFLESDSTIFEEEKNQLENSFSPFFNLFD